ncbi:MAG: hypothetical protein HRU41_06095 [Saprospiraceae bacterium]|nr:hypothetical protein [Saprospiraceae bacterium]
MNYIYLAILKEDHSVDEQVQAFLEKHQMTLLQNYENLGVVKIASPDLIMGLPYFLAAIELEQQYYLEEE